MVLSRPASGSATFAPLRLSAPPAAATRTSGLELQAAGAAISLWSGSRRGQIGRRYLRRRGITARIARMQRLLRTSTATALGLGLWG
jgi:hypothetical protein